MPVRYSRWRLLVAVVLLLLFVALLIAGRLLHWDDQLRLYWSERSVTAEQRAAGIWLPDYELALETTLAGLEDDETSGLTWTADRHAVHRYRQTSAADRVHPGRCRIAAHRTDRLLRSGSGGGAG